MPEQFSSQPPLSSSHPDFQLFLASASPRRAQLLHTIDMPFTVVVSSADEPPPTAQDDRTPARYVERLARHKAAHCDLAAIEAAQRAAASSVLSMNGNPMARGGVESIEAIRPTMPAPHAPMPHAPMPHAPVPTPLVLAADTVVWYGGRIFGKPRDEAHAQRILTALRGETHQVYTGICLRHGDKYHVAHEATSVRFRTVSDEWITRYIASGEPMDKAGAYAAQGRGAMLIERIEGDFWNVVGLPLGCLGRLLESLGAPIEMWWS